MGLSLTVHRLHAQRGRDIKVRRKQVLLLLTLLIALLLLSACGVQQQGVDVTTTEPEGLWQTLVVWPMAKALIWLDEMLQRFGGPYHWGFAIILFTIIIKVVTFPLTLTQIRGMEAQKALQPKIQELQKKYGKDRERLSREQMKLYQEAGVNPLSGCLPLIVQMPILFGLYAALVALGPYLGEQPFFFIPDLGFPAYTRGMSWITEFAKAGTAVPAGMEYLGKSGYYLLIAYLILPILLMATQFVMQKWMTPAPPTGGSEGGMAGMTKQVGLMMTFMFGFFTLQVPAGLTLYWVTSNGLQMLQQWAITNNRFNLTKVTIKESAITSDDEDADVAPSENGAQPVSSQQPEVASMSKAKAGSNKSRRGKRK